MKNGTLPQLQMAVNSLNVGFQKHKADDVEGLRLMQANAHAILFHCWIAEAKAFLKANSFNGALQKCGVVFEEYGRNEECIEIVQKILQINPALKEHLHQYGIDERMVA